MGKKKIEYKLINEKRVNEKLVYKALAEFFDKDLEKDKCREYAIKYMEKKHLTLDMEGKAKVGQHLYQKGYNWDTITAVLATISKSR